MTQQELDKLLNRAKVGLMTYGSVFLITVAFNLKYKWDKNTPTASVDGITIKINPEFFENLTEPQRIFLIAHEVWHVAFDHLLRCGDKDPELWNEAGDYVINIMLVDASFEMPPQGLLEKKYRGWSTLKVYEDIDKPGRNKPVNSMAGDLIKPTTPKEIQEVEANIKNILVKATTQSKMAGEKPGTIPNEISREIDELLTPVLPWQQLLQNFMAEKSKDDYTWSRPNKRFMPDFYLPTQFSDSLAHVTVAIDTSGSVTQEMLNEMLSEIFYIKETFNPKKMTILDCDTKIHNIYNLDETSSIHDLKFSGNGGTRFSPVIDYCKENHTNALLYFTDMYGSLPEHDPGFPILWLCYSNHEPAKIGQTIYYDNNR